MRILFFCFFLGAFLSGQTINGKVLSQNDSRPIPYAKIGIGSEENGTIADENGNYTLDVSTVNKELDLIVAVGGFNTFTVSINTFLQNNTHNILLKEKVRDIPEVVIIPKQFKDRHWGVDSKSKKILFATYPERKKEKKNNLVNWPLSFQTKRR